MDRGSFCFLFEQQPNLHFMHGMDEKDRSETGDTGTLRTGKNMTGSAGLTEKDKLDRTANPENTTLSASVTFKKR